MAATPEPYKYVQKTNVMTILRDDAEYKMKDTDTQLLVPVVITMEGVHNGAYKAAAEIVRAFEFLDSLPVPHYATWEHPVKILLTQFNEAVGWVDNFRIRYVELGDGKKKHKAPQIIGDAHLCKKKCSPEQIDKVKDGKVNEVSIGFICQERYFEKPKKFMDLEYLSTEHEIIINHTAFLEANAPACKRLPDGEGCGTLAGGEPDEGSDAEECGCDAEDTTGAESTHNLAHAEGEAGSGVLAVKVSSASPEEGADPPNDSHSKDETPSQGEQEEGIMPDPKDEKNDTEEPVPDPAKPKEDDLAAMKEKAKADALAKAKRDEEDASTKADLEELAQRRENERLEKVNELASLTGKKADEYKDLSGVQVNSLLESTKTALSALNANFIAGGGAGVESEPDTNQTGKEGLTVGHWNAEKGWVGGLELKD